MTEFETIKNALSRVRADLEIYDFPTGKSIFIPINSLMAEGIIQLELEFDVNGKLVDTFTWD